MLASVAAQAMELALAGCCPKFLIFTLKVSPNFMSKSWTVCNMIVDFAGSL